MDRPITSAFTAALSRRSTERAVPRLQADLASLREQMATGRRVTTASDDPDAFASSRALRGVEDRYARYGRSLDAARLWVDQTETELTALSDLFVEAKVVGLRAANGILDTDQLASQVESLRAEAIDRLTAKSGGEFLFSGNETQTAPLNPDGTPGAGTFDGERRREIGPGTTLTVNIPGSEALNVDGVPAVDRLQALADAIRTGDTDAVRATLDGIEAGADHYTRLATRTGRTAVRLTSAQDGMEAQGISVAGRRSELEDADLAQVIGEMQRRQTTLEAALRATSASLQTTLLDYLR